MTVKVIATDMDGTFLNSQGQYDRERFQKLLRQLQERDIRFVVASGNQYQQLRDQFPDCHEQLTFVSENGANIIHKDKPLIEVFQNREDIAHLIHFVEQEYPEAVISLSGEEKAYLRRDAPHDIIEWLLPFLPNLELVEELLPLPHERFFKLTLKVEEEAVTQVRQAIDSFETSDRLVSTSSGFGCIDVITKGLHKGWALEQLLKGWNYKSDNLMVFGDSGNDVEMLKLAKYSYAMANASKEAKVAARYQASSNDDSGVLEVIENYLAAL
ncbi:Cof-type HAD-IIB family hydrolase [Streptococcus orisasini]|uniref:Cof-type HAD-IIB family hydrolase n=1 Tax=Streptococcus orisasini TaxID=1080071 RepID=UPI00070EDCC9|nr:Cof-type HAD-IIB family hydrolase [Streptococcus orisasini]